MIKVTTLLHSSRLGEDDDGAAKVGVVETTKEAMKFKHPDNENIVFVDLPGIGTPNFPEKKYYKTVGLKDYDTFLILTSDRFTENDLKLAKKVKEMAKSFFFIRTKIKRDLTDKMSRVSVNEKEFLETIKSDCFAYLKDLIPRKEDIFLIDNYDKQQWDFARLIAAIKNALPDRQKECLILSLSNVTRTCIEKRQSISKVGNILFNYKTW